MKKILHSIGIHDWKRWISYNETYEYYPRIGFMGPIDTQHKATELQTWQKRTCKICGEVENRRIK